MDEHSKDQDLEKVRNRTDGDYLTTNQGVRINDNQNSLKVGSRGPTLLEDFHFREKITHFDHERIPERVVHARGSGAHGYFQVYEPMAEYTMAKFLQNPDIKTPVFVRFSTVVGSRGSADTVRDARGFATKFYTEDGNYDLVGNNIPVFFIQDAVKFPDLIHAIKPEPDNEMPQAASAHDTFWDFVSLTPETTHMVMWLMSDRGIPRSFRMMEGFGVNTYRLVNEQGKSRFVKFHWKPILGVHSLDWDEAQKLAGKDPDYHRRDLWEAIERGDFPEYEFAVQMVEEADEFKYGFDILDPTKTWPEDAIPLMRIGKMTLNRNPDNFFAETEQVAFCVQHVVPGIDFSNDPLLQGRTFSYLDTQLIRLGPNFAQLPINQPLAKVSNNQRDGYMRYTIEPGKGAYDPNSVRNGFPKEAPADEGGYVSYYEKIDGRKIRERSPSFSDHFSQPSQFWAGLRPWEKEHFVKTLHFELGKVERMEIRQRVVELLKNVNEDLAARVAVGIGVPAEALPEPVPVAPAGTVEADSAAKTRMVAILAADGFDPTVVIEVRSALESAGAHPQIVSKFLSPIHAANGEEITVDKSFLTSGSIMFDAVFVPGGKQSIDALSSDGDALHFVNEAYRHCKPIGAVGEGVDLLIESDIKGISIAGPEAAEEVVSDEGVVTARKPSDIHQFDDQFVDAVSHHRYWGREMKQHVPA